jgi:hypothetical protein
MAASRSQDTNVDDGETATFEMRFCKTTLILGYPRASERYAPENLQWRASLVWEEDRDALLEIPTLPIDQITEGSDCLASQAGICCHERLSRSIALRMVMSLRATR